MNSYSLHLKQHFSSHFLEKNFIKVDLVPKPYSEADFKMVWQLPNFIDGTYVYQKILDTFRNDNDEKKTLVSVSCILNQNNSSSITIIINPTYLDEYLYKQVIHKLTYLIDEYEKFYELKKPFSPLDE